MAEPVFLKQTDWARLERNLNAKEKELAAIEASAAERQTMREKSYRLQKKWKKKQRIRQKTQDTREDDEDEIERERERCKYLESSAKLVYNMNDSVKVLNRALLSAEVLREREEQVKFANKLKEISEKREALALQQTRQRSLDNERAIQDEIQLRKTRNIEYQTSLLNQVSDLQAARKTAADTEKQLAAAIDEEVKRKLENERKCEKERKDNMRKIWRRSVLENLEKNRLFRERIRLEDEDDTKLMSAYSAAKQWVAQQCRIKEKEIQENVARRRQNVVGKFEAVEKDLEEIENHKNQKIRGVIEKFYEEDKKAHKEREVYRKKLVDEVVQDQQSYLEARERESRQIRELEEWKALQRFSTEQVTDQFFKVMEEKKRETMALMREKLNAQMEEKQAKMKIERERNIRSANRKQISAKAEENTFLKYAGEVVQDSREIGRPLLPINKALLKYKLSRGLVPGKKPNPALESVIPFGRIYPPKY